MEQFDHYNWYALYTKSRHEKFVESELLKKGVETFAPKIRLRKRWSDRVKYIEEPLFKSYCFARFCLRDKVQILSQNGVAAIVHFNSRYIPIEKPVIDSLKILIDNDLRIDPFPYLRIGERVVLRKGPLKGVEGYIVEKRNKNTTLVVSIDAINTSVKCVVESAYVGLA